ncbi:MAG: 4-hydroxy-tetrahydrodipicolinate synthase [Clostridia bacterium]|nr:4-hydroxy-tetrahydrodipicolinate synthase [Clostridia bacterium]
MSASLLFSGCATALVTPFHPDGSLDEDAFIRLLLRQLSAGIDALVVLGTTGEPSTLSMHERERIITSAVTCAEGRVPVIVGTGSNDTRKAIEYARQAADLGAQGQLCVTPYYNKTTQTGLIRHFEAVLDSCRLPMILYNVPSRTGMSISEDTAAALSRHPQVAGIKEASGDPAYTLHVLQKTHGELAVYSGNDDIIVPLMACGAKGAISVCSNILPAQTRAMTHACLSGCFDEAQQAQCALTPLIRALFAQVNPIPVKAALSMMGLMEETLRLPLTPLEEPYRAALKALLIRSGLASESE